MWPTETGGLASVSQDERRLIRALRKNGNLLLKIQAWELACRITEVISSSEYVRQQL